MNHQDFVKKYTQKFYEYDNAYGSECVDLFKGYYRDVKEFRINVSLGAAKNYWTHIEKAGLTRTTEPTRGDVAFTNYTKFGHVGIFDRFDKDGFWQFDQLGNGEQVGGEKPCKLRFYPMSKLLGFATINKPDPNEAIVKAFADKHGIEGRSKTKSFTQFDILLVLSKILGQK